MTAPCAGSDVTLRVAGELVSRPYVDMTIANMRQFGAEVAEPAPNVFEIRGPALSGLATTTIEPDASAASYFFALAAVTGGDITVEGSDPRRPAGRRRLRRGAGAHGLPGGVRGGLDPRRRRRARAASTST